MFNFFIKIPLRVKNYMDECWTKIWHLQRVKMKQMTSLKVWRLTWTKESYHSTQFWLSTPPSTDSDESNDGLDLPNVGSRAGNKKWCECKKCEVEQREIDAVCCREYWEITEEMFEVKYKSLIFYYIISEEKYKIVLK